MRFGILGPLEVLDRDGIPLDVKGAKLRALLTMFVLCAGEAVTTDQLSDALWGDSPPASAANALQSHISKLRGILGPGLLETLDGSYSLVVDAGSIDAREFLRLARSGHEQLAAGQAAIAVTILREALALWRGRALADLDNVDVATAERVRLDEALLNAREDLLEAELAEGGHDTVVAHVEAALVEHPLRERLWVLLMRAQYRSGRQADALRAFQRARTVLAEELGLEPGPELRDTERRILAHDPDLLAPKAPLRAESSAGSLQRGGAARQARLSNLHPALSSFVGRDADVAALDALISERRLVTITGPGGVGKTRLATEVALGSLERWNDGVWYVDLGAESGDGAAERALRRTFGPRLGHADADTASWLTVGLAATELLMVLDNCEHVLGVVAPLVESMLRACPGLHVLATSREPLGCPGEQVRRLAPLPLDEAIVLFTARAADSSIVLDGDETTTNAVDSICAQLDRLPLAIELAAARIRVFPALQLAAMLQQRTALASTNSASRPPRQQTLAAAVDWSYELLFDDERRLLARLSVFSGGFTLEAVAAVCADELLSADEIGLLLARLVDKSLVTPVSVPGLLPRFRLLRPVAEFAADCLQRAGEDRLLRSRHTRWLIGLTAPITDGLRSADALVWVEVVNSEIANLARAADWGLREGDAEDALEVAINLAWYAFVSANIYDDHPTLLAILDRAPHAPASLRCRGMAWAGLLSIGHSDGRTWAMDAIDVARTAAQSAGITAGRVRQQHGVEMTMASIAMARDLGDAALLIEVLGIGALHLAAVGRTPDTVSTIAAELAALAASVDDAWHLALSIGLEALAMYARDDLDGALESFTRCIAEMRRFGDVGTAAMFEISWAEAAELRGDIPGAVEAVAAAYSLGSAGQFLSSTILCSVLCWLTTRNGEVQRSLDLGREALAAVRRPFNPVIRAQALFALGSAEERAGLHDDAAEHLVEALAIHERVGMLREAAMDHRHLGFVASARGAAAAAIGHHRRAVALALEVGLAWTIMLTARSLAEALLDDDQVEVACTLTGVTESISASYGYTPTAEERPRLDAVRDRCVAALGDVAFAAAARRGASLGVAGLGQLVAGGSR